MVGYILPYILHTRMCSRPICSIRALRTGATPCFNSRASMLLARAMRLPTAAPTGRIAHSMGFLGPLPIRRRAPPGIGHHPQALEGSTQHRHHPQVQAQGHGHGGRYLAIVGHAAKAGHPALGSLFLVPVRQGVRVGTSKPVGAVAWARGTTWAAAGGGPGAASVGPVYG